MTEVHIFIKRPNSFKGQLWYFSGLLAPPLLLGWIINVIHNFIEILKYFHLYNIIISPQADFATFIYLFLFLFSLPICLLYLTPFHSSLLIWPLYWSLLLYLSFLLSFPNTYLLQIKNVSSIPPLSSYSSPQTPHNSSFFRKCHFFLSSIHVTSSKEVLVF